MQTGIVETGFFLNRSCALLPHSSSVLSPWYWMYQYLSHLAATEKRANDSVHEAHRFNKMYDSTGKIEKPSIPVSRQSTSRVWRWRQRLVVQSRCHELLKLGSSTAELSNPCEYYVRNTAIPFLDHIIMPLNQQLFLMSPDCNVIFGLIPSVFCEREVNLQELRLCRHMPKISAIPELRSWKNRFLCTAQAEGLAQWLRSLPSNPEVTSPVRSEAKLIIVKRLWACCMENAPLYFTFTAPELRPTSPAVYQNVWQQNFVS